MCRRLFLAMQCKVGNIHIDLDMFHTAWNWFWIHGSESIFNFIPNYHNMILEHFWMMKIIKFSCPFSAKVHLALDTFITFQYKRGKYQCSVSNKKVHFGWISLTAKEAVYPTGSIITCGLYDFLPHFSCPFLCFQGVFFRKFCPYVYG